MKKVDGNYSYDELEGFEPVSLRETVVRRERIQMRLQSRSFVLTETAIRALGHPDYVSCMINRERKLLLVAAADPQDKNAVKMAKTNSTAKNKMRFESTKLAKVVEKLTNRATAVVNMNFEGSAARSKQNTLIFDLTNMQVYEKRKYQMASGEKKGTK